ncbi:hypothetical protein HK100_004270, partial [Physocladia obscura]
MHPTPFAATTKRGPKTPRTQSPETVPGTMAQYSYSSSLISDDSNEFLGGAQQNVYYQQHHQIQISNCLNTRAMSVSNYADINAHQFSPSS